MHVLGIILTFVLVELISSDLKDFIYACLLLVNFIVVFQLVRTLYRVLLDRVIRKRHEEAINSRFVFLGLAFATVTSILFLNEVLQKYLIILLIVVLVPVLLFDTFYALLHK